MSIPVVVNGVVGRMGQTVLAALCQDPETTPVGGVDPRVTGDTMYLPDGKGAIPVGKDLSAVLARAKPLVLVDFSIAEATVPTVRAAAQHGVHVVVGTTGQSPEQLKQVEAIAGERGIGVVVAPNFALGAVLMMHLAAQVAKYFEYAEIIELHHEAKIDSPSGTAVATARAMAAARGQPFKRTISQKEPVLGARGGEVGGISLHSVRLQGLVAHQEVILGGIGQTLTIRHDTTGRDSFMPGVLLAVKEVAKRKKYIYGLDVLLGLR